VVNLTWMPILVATNPDVPAKDLPTLIEWIRAQKAPVQYASPGTGSLTQLWGELLAQRYKLSLQGIPFKGSAEAARAAVAGEVPLLFDVVGTTGNLIHQGRLRGIVTPGKQRAPGLPDVPTASESGISGLDANSFLGLMGPAGMPSDVRDKLNAAVNRVLRNPGTIAALQAQGLTPAGGTPQTFGQLLADEMKRWTEVAKTAGIKSAP
jgi:tripartite-type tricarboxylate transporter receptor subunit TctC